MTGGDKIFVRSKLWFAKKSQETRPEMLKQEGKYKGRTKTVDDHAIRLAMSKNGASFRKVAKDLKVSLSTVQRAMKEDAKIA